MSDEDPERILSARKALDQALSDRGQGDLSWIDPPPTDDGWTLAPDALRFLWNLVRHLRPQHVVEFGSGLSTRLLLRAIEGMDGAISSIDHDPQFGAAPDAPAVRF